MGRLKGKGATLQEEEKVIYLDTFRSYILKLKHENFVLVYWVLTSYMYVMHSDSLIKSKAIMDRIPKLKL